MAIGRVKGRRKPASANSATNGGSRLMMAIERSLAASRRTSCSRCPEASLGRVDTVMRYRPPDAAVQGLVGSSAWIAFADNGGGDRPTVDLTPGPRGHTEQIIILSHKENIGASLVADSLTDLV